MFINIFVLNVLQFCILIAYAFSVIDFNKRLYTRSKEMQGLSNNILMLFFVAKLVEEMGGGFLLI